MLEVAAGLSCLITGIDPVNPNGKCLGFDAKTGKIGYMESNGGAIGAMGNMIGMLYTPPAHTRDYIVNLAQNFGISRPTYARWMIDDEDIQNTTPKEAFPNGAGFKGLSPFLGIWKIFRNMVYLFFVLIFIVIGVAIMLRVRIDPRTVMTIQNQIPKLIMGILLVTFSFAIAGFLIDLMWTVIYLSFNLFRSIDHVNLLSFMPQDIAGANPIGAAGGIGGIGKIAGNASGGIKGVISSLFDNTYGTIIAGIIGGIVGGGAGAMFGGVGLVVGAVAGGIVGGILGNEMIGFIAGIIAFLIIAISLLIALFRVWFTLLTAYVMILIDVVFAPFWILAGLFPGSKLNFNTWVRDIASNLAAFPAVYIMFLLAKTFMDLFNAAAHQSASAPSWVFVPPLIGNAGNVKAFASLIGLGIILIMPNVVRMMKTALGAPQIDLSGALAGIAAGTAVAGAGARPVWNKLTRPYNYQSGEPEGPLRRRLFGVASPPEG